MRELQIALNAAYGHRTLLPAAVEATTEATGQSQRQSAPDMANSPDRQAGGESRLGLSLARSGARDNKHSMPCHKRSYLCASVETDPIQLAASSMTLSHEHVALTFRTKNKQLQQQQQ